MSLEKDLLPTLDTFGLHGPADLYARFISQVNLIPYICMYMFSRVERSIERDPGLLVHSSGQIASVPGQKKRKTRKSQI